MKLIKAEELKDTDLQLNKIILLFSKQYPEPRYYEERGKKIYLLGTPIWNNRVDYESVKKMLLEKKIEDFIKDLNGSFLIIIYYEDRKELLVVNDRFASVQFYYRVDKGSFIGATNYSDIWRAFSNRDYFRVNIEAFYEFIYMRRLYGDKTYDCKTKFLNSASILRYASNFKTLTITRYWRPDCRIKKMSLQDKIHRLAFLIRQSFERATSDSKKFGLLLSGGLDSRCILAASNKPLVCITTCEYKNNEYYVANDLSRVKHYEHIFITKPATYYSDILDKAVYISAAMSIYANAHFFNIENKVNGKVDVFLHGYGFDFLFRGKYLPNTVHPLLEKITYKRSFVPIDKSSKHIAEEFIGNISYRLKSIDPARLLKYKYRKKMIDSLYYSIKDIIDEAKELSDDPYKWWDYCCFHNISRHYTWLNILSIRSFIEERTIVFDNDLFDFFWSLNPASLLNGNIFMNTIRLLDPEVFKIRYANTNLSLGDPAIITSAKIIINKILKETRLNKIFTKSLPPPPPKERSWPIDACLIRENQKVRELALSLCKSNSLEKLPFLDMDTISSCVKNHIEGKQNHMNLIFSLITLNKFLE